MLKNKEIIQIILTGGTIDFTWSGKVDTAVAGQHSYLPEFFKSIDLYDDLEFSELFIKDSRNLTREDVEKILEEIEKSKNLKIIMTHGTYTMPDTARYLQANLNRKDQTIVVTGAMTPLKGFAIGDAAFNLGYAISKVQDLGAGIYVCINGATFTPDEVAKSLSEGKFYSIFKKEQ